MNKWTEEQKQKIKLLWLNNVPRVQMASLLNKTEGQIAGYIQRNVKRWPMREREKISAIPKFSLFREKPTPENTIVHDPPTEYEMPENALNIPFKDVVSGQCGFLSGGFWDEPNSETPCCGLPVYDPKGKGLRRQYCEFHYKISIEEVK